MLFVKPHEEGNITKTRELVEADIGRSSDVHWTLLVWINELEGSQPLGSGVLNGKRR